MEVWVPEERLRNTKVRKPITRGQSKKIYAVLKRRASFKMSSKAKERAQYYKDKVLSGDPVELAETVRDLVRLSIRKSLNVREAGDRQRGPAHPDAGAGAGHRQGRGDSKRGAGRYALSLAPLAYVPLVLASEPDAPRLYRATGATLFSSTGMQISVTSFSLGVVFGSLQ